MSVHYFAGDYKAVLVRSNKAALIALRMKTTFDLPEEVLKEAKIYAARNQTTLKELVVRGLRLVSSGLEEEAESLGKKRRSALLNQMVASNTKPMQLGERDESYNR